MPPAGFEPAIPASERQHTQALDRAATGIGGCEDVDWMYLVGAKVCCEYGNEHVR
jgi:hypothetical protein